jgi:hypothetical protein
VNGVQTVVVRINEKGKGHLMKDASAVGRYWIDPATGAVYQIELGFSAPNANIHSTVKLTKDAQLDLLVPSELAETVELSSATGAMSQMGSGGTPSSQREALEGHATYTKYRRAGGS